MKIQATHEYNAPPEKVFTALIDPAVLQKCIEGCEQMEKTGEDSYDAKLKIGVAGIKGKYTGKVRIAEKKPPESFTLQAEGNGTPGWVKGTAKIRIAPKQILAKGIAQIPQAHSLFADMTVQENVEMGAYSLREKAVMRKRLAQVQELYPIVRDREELPQDGDQFHDVH